MRVYFGYKIFGFVIFAVLGFCCSTVNTTLLNNKLEINTSVTPIPPDSLQKYEAKFVKEEGWEIPLPEKRKATRTIEREAKSENGTSVKRMLTVYIPIDAFFFQREPYASGLDKEMTTGLLRLQAIYELKVKEKIYGYTIYAQKTALDEQTRKSVPSGKIFFYQCFDTDGDGKFETLVTDQSGISVPDWVTQ